MGIALAAFAAALAACVSEDPAAMALAGVLAAAPLAACASEASAAVAVAGALAALAARVSEDAAAVARLGYLEDLVGHTGAFGAEGRARRLREVMSIGCACICGAL